MCISQEWKKDIKNIIDSKPFKDATMLYLFIRDYNTWLRKKGLLKTDITNNELIIMFINGDMKKERIKHEKTKPKNTR